MHSGILGQLAAIFVAAAISPAVTAWAMYLVQDQDASIGEAINVPFKLLKEKSFWTVILVVFVAGLIAAVGVLACGIGALFTAPFSVCMIAAAYEECYGKPAQGISVDAPAPEAPASDASSSSDAPTL